MAGYAAGIVILAPWSDALMATALLPDSAAALWAVSSLVTKWMTRTENTKTLTVYLLLLLKPINAGVAMGEGSAVDFGIAGNLLLDVGVLTGLAQYVLALAHRGVDASTLKPFN